MQTSQHLLFLFLMLSDFYLLFLLHQSGFTGRRTCELSKTNYCLIVNLNQSLKHPWIPPAILGYLLLIDKKWPSGVIFFSMRTTDISILHCKKTTAFKSPLFIISRSAQCQCEEYHKSQSLTQFLYLVLLSTGIPHQKSSLKSRRSTWTTDDHLYV